MLIEKIKNNSVTIVVVGLCYVGLPLVLRFCEMEFNVIGFDVDDTKLKKLEKAESYLDHISDNTISNLIESDFTPTSDFSEIEKCDCILICVPTPIVKNKYFNCE